MMRPKFEPLPPHIDEKEIDHRAKSERVYQPRLLKMSDVEAKSVSWLWPSRIPSGCVSLVVGMPGVGKSFLTAEIAARITNGRRWPDDTECRAGSVLLLTAEDDPSYTIKPRLDACGADTDRVSLLTGLYDPERPDEVDLMIGLGDIEPIAESVRSMSDCRLVVVDPIGSYMGGKTDVHRDNEVRAVLAPLAKLAEQEDIAVVMIAHRRKAASTHADDLALGSRAFTGVSRSVLHVMFDPTDEGPIASRRRLVLPGKCNLSAPAAGLAYTIEGHPASIVWDDDMVSMTANDALAAERANEHSGQKSAPKTNEAVEWLRHNLAHGPRPAKDVKRDALNDTIAGRTLDRAAQELAVVKKPAGLALPWVWHLPGDSRDYVLPSVAKESQSRQGKCAGETDETGETDDGSEDILI